MGELDELWKQLRPPICAISTPHPTDSRYRTQTHWMMGYGPVPAHGMIIGDSPNGAEDREGHPVLDEFLNAALDEVGLSQRNLYLTYAVKCAVPKDERPDYNKKTFNEYRAVLRNEILAVKPRAVLICGQYALESLLKRTGITKVRGLEVFDSELNCWFVVTVSPAYVLRNPTYMEAFQSDLQKFQRRLTGQTIDEEVEVVWCNTVEAVQQALKELDETQGNIVTHDLETKGFHYYFNDSKIWCASLSKDPKKAYVIPLEHPESPFVYGYAPWPAKPLAVKKDAGAMEWLKKPWTEVARPELYQVYDLLREWFKGKAVNGHNLKFDAEWDYQRQIEYTIAFDTAIAAHLMNENRAISLKDRMVTEYGFSNWGKGKIGFDPPSPLFEMGEYNGRDSAHCHRLYLRDKDFFFEHQSLARLFKFLVLPGVRALMEMEMTGIWVDLEALEERKAGALQRAREIEQELLSMVDPSIKESVSVINFNSDPFLQKWLYTAVPAGLGLPVIKRTPRKKPSVDAETLDTLSKLHPALALLLEMRKQDKIVEFLDSWKALVDDYHRIHPDYNPTGTKTGRRSCSKPNLQQVPREGTLEGVRSCLGAPPGWDLVTFDYSQIELRIAALESRDPVMLRAYQLDRDLHVLTAAMVTGKLAALQADMGLKYTTVVSLLENDEFCARLKALVTDSERRMAKAVNFGFLYGMGWKKFSMYAETTYGVKVTDEQAKEFRKAFFALYAGLVDWHNRKRRDVRTDFKVVSLIGRERNLLMILSTDEGVQASAERQGINSTVQGLGGDLIFMSEGILYRMFLDHAEEIGEKTVMMVGDVHDELIFQVRSDYREFWIPKIREVMENLPLDKFGLKPDIPILTEPKWGARWGKLLEWHEQVAA